MAKGSLLSRGDTDHAKRKGRRLKLAPSVEKLNIPEIVRLDLCNVSKPAIHYENKECPKRNPHEPGTLDYALECVLNNQNSAKTPVLLNVASENNMMIVKVEKIRELQKFAEEVDQKELQFVTSRPFKVTPCSPKGQDGIPHQLEGVFRLYLNGSGPQRGKSVSLSVCFRETANQTRSLAVSFFLSDPENKKSGACLRKSFSMTSQSAAENGKEVHRGVADFVSKEEFESFVEKDGSVTFGLSVLAACS